MHRLFFWLIVLGGLVLFALIVYNAMGPPEREVIVQHPSLPEPTPPAAPEIRYPVTEMSAGTPLPALDTSDATLKNSVAELLPDSALANLPVFKDFVRHVVATVDNLSRRSAAPRLWPLKPAPGHFKVNGGDEHFTIAPDNFTRYSIYVRLAESVDSARLAAIYLRYYPLFQQAYRDLGYPKAHFNDRLVEVIDHLLSTPEAQDTIALVRPKVFYEYADPDLEKRSAGQKILIRAGTENARRIKAKLREFRGEITGNPAKPKGE